MRHESSSTGHGRSSTRHERSSMRHGRPSMRHEGSSTPPVRSSLRHERSSMPPVPPSMRHEKSSTRHGGSPTAELEASGFGSTLKKDARHYARGSGNLGCGAWSPRSVNWQPGSRDWLVGSAVWTDGSADGAPGGFQAAVQHLEWRRVWVAVAFLPLLPHYSRICRHEHLLQRLGIHAEDKNACDGD